MTHFPLRLPETPSKDRESTRAAVGKIGKAFLLGLVQMGSLGFGLKRRRPARRSDAQALAGDWQKVGDGMKGAMARAQDRLDRR